MHMLHIGDATEDRQLIVCDEDRLCYQVRWMARGRYSIRTISKTLLEEWVMAYAENPGAKSKDMRERLRERSDVDRYEYGYNATLATRAKRILGHIPVCMVN